MNYWEDKCCGDLNNMETKERNLTLSREEIEILTCQLACRIDELDKHIKDKAIQGLDFNGTYELKNKLCVIQNKLYQIL